MGASLHLPTASPPHCQGGPSSQELQTHPGQALGSPGGAWHPFLLPPPLPSSRHGEHTASAPHHPSRPTRRRRKAIEVRGGGQPTHHARRGHPSLGDMQSPAQGHLWGSDSIERQPRRSSAENHRVERIGSRCLRNGWLTGAAPSSADPGRVGWKDGPLFSPRHVARRPPSQAAERQPQPA